MRQTLGEQAEGSRWGGWGVERWAKKKKKKEKNSGILTKVW